MEVQTAREIASLLSKNGSEESDKYRLEKHISRQRLTDFHQWANDRPSEGAFLFKNSAGKGLWIVLIDWRESNNFYVVLFPESKSGPIAEIHRVVAVGAEPVLHWRYSPSKHDDKNDERKAYFAEAFLSTDVQISIPQSISEVDDFVDELFVLSESRAKADRLDPDRPATRTGFPEGKLKEKLHIARERNQELVRLAKVRAMSRDGSLECACCGFDFHEKYGEVGRGFIEAHHTKPISELHEDGEETKVEDLALVCSNCHRARTHMRKEGKRAS